MGLDFNVGEAHWSYPGFMAFREKVAKEIDLDLHLMSGYHVNGVAWDILDDPIKLLLNHSDCDGRLQPHECQAVAKRLLEIIEHWPDDDWDKARAIELIDGMNECVEQDIDLIFC